MLDIAAGIILIASCVVAMGALVWLAYVLWYDA